MAASTLGLLTGLLVLFFVVVMTTDYVMKYRYVHSQLSANQLAECKLVLWKPLVFELHFGDDTHFRSSFTYRGAFGRYRLIGRVTERDEPSR